jgi:hypothetical protein
VEYLIGVLLALGVAAFAALTGFDRDRSFYPTVLIVVGAYYILFAAMGAVPARTLTVEIAAASAFLVLAAVGFKRNSCRPGGLDSASPPMLSSRQRSLSV